MAKLKKSSTVHKKRFFFLHCRASTGHGRSTLEMCESKRVKLELLAESFHRQGSRKNKQKQKQTTNNKNHNTKKQPVKILAKVVKPARPLKPLRSSLPPCSMSSMPSKQLIRCPSCPLLCLPALADLSHQVRAFAL